MTEEYVSEALNWTTTTFNDTKPFVTGTSSTTMSKNLELNDVNKPSVNQSNKLQ